MKRKLLIFSVSIVLIVIAGGCTVDPDARLNRALDRYIEKGPGALQDLQLAFISYASVDSLEGDDLQTDGNLLYRLSNSRAEIVLPRNLTLDLEDSEIVTQVAADDNHAVITDGLRLAVFSGSGSHIQDVAIGDTKSPVRSLALDGDSVLYYRNSRIYRYDIATQAIEQVVKETFPSPYTSYYTACIHKKGALLSVLAGIAGSYSFSIVNIETGSVIVKNLMFSSSRYFQGTKAVYYIGGSSGRWELVRFDLAAKTKKILARFDDLIDIALGANGYVCQTGDGLWTATYGNDRKRIPFSYELAGLHKGRVLLHYKGVYYFIDMVRLQTGLMKIMERAPKLNTPPSP